MVFFGGAAFLAFGAAAFFFGGIVGVEARRLRKRRWFVSAVIGCGEKVSQKSNINVVSDTPVCLAGFGCEILDES